MTFGKRKLLVAFLEKDNLKLLAYETSGKELTRIFGGQISFSPDVMRDSFISDPVKFAAQVKAALSQKAEMTAILEGVLFIPAEKSYIKSMPASDAIEGFVRSLPYFKEELIIDPQVPTVADSAKQTVNHLAFEKKLVEDLERPFLDSGKRILAVVSSIKALVEAHSQTGRYILLFPFEKEVAMVACESGAILDMASFARDIVVGRLNEFRLGKGFSDIKSIYTVGIFDTALLDKIRSEQQLTVTELDKRDIYDLAVESYSRGPSNNAASSGVKMPTVGLPAVPNVSNLLQGKQKYLFLVAAIAVGFLLMILVFRNAGKVNLSKLNGSSGKTKSPIVNSGSAQGQKAPTPTPIVETKPGDFKVRVLNGTKVTGEAGKLGDVLKGLGFDVVETKNATSSAFENTKLRVAAGVPAKISDQVKATLAETYASVDMESLASDAAGVRIEVIIGPKK